MADPERETSRWHLKAQQHFLGIDVGTQGLSIVWVDSQMEPLATAEADYAMVPDQPAGHYAQRPADWLDALRRAMAQLHAQADRTGLTFRPAAIGLCGQMHGEVLCDDRGQPLQPARLWCDIRNQSEGDELTELFGVKVPKRMTVARWLWTIRQRPDVARRTHRLTTPAGWLAHQLTGQWVLGIGDASGMFPIDTKTGQFDSQRLAVFDSCVGDPNSPRLQSLLPVVRRAGEDAGALSESGARLLGLAVGTPVAAAEGDQPASLAGALIGRAGMASVSLGTSVCANSVGDHPFRGVDRAVDHFCAADGKPINMVCLRNGTTFMNAWVRMLASAAGIGVDQAFERFMPEVLAAKADCGGLIGLPFIDDEPGLGIERGGNGALLGLDEQNATPGNMVKAALLATLFNLRWGLEGLDRQGFPRTEIVLSGGLVRTPETGQIVADVMQTPVSLLPSADEGTAWGAALLANYRFQRIEGDATSWSDFLDRWLGTPRRKFQPQADQAALYRQGYDRYRDEVNRWAARETVTLISRPDVPGPPG